MNHRDWYESVAARDGGYVRTWRSTIEGRSGEAAFEQCLFAALDPRQRVLDAGCGSGAFTLRVAKRVREVVGFDFAAGMIAAAEALREERGSSNVRFLVASSHDLPFEPGTFDLVYTRRGPTSVLSRPDLLAPGGWLLGIHSERPRVEERLAASGLEDVEIEVFEAVERFPTLTDFARFWSRMPGHPDYLEAEQREALAVLARDHRDERGLHAVERRFVWRGRRPDRERRPVASRASGDG